MSNDKVEVYVRPCAPPWPARTAKKYTINRTFMTANKARRLPCSPVVNYCFIA